ncbi:hypothetical protein BD309DRAFT_977667 [Dichomitus squalens]|uniref:GST N-terminal domain-containing protein n=1 Tax=Dichomitus squalens TaxID=114155 RepID=A0A4Q9P5F8_9APHY|nr:hypothetical protein BD311DRAFT_745699 [Dichomitus squalens]TBU48407.1 hypothetical protein BD309DRAFT_977667 [Dichomitus squalens]TBU64991.1 hypothetical protein BD310DRAFT_296365 [Dichomitus squalens]
MSKPVFYTFGLSVWAAAPELAIAELGYPDDAIETKVVNLAEGANFTPEFLKINPHATLPTLAADGKTYTSTKEVVSYLVANAPKKVAKGTTFIDKIHEEKYDPNAPLLLSRNEEELKAAAGGFPLQFVQNRQNTLEKHADLPEAAEHKAFYDAKRAANGGILAIYKGEVPEDVKQGFFKQSVAHWQTLANFILVDLPAVLPESGFLGGETPGEDDFHLAAWLARIAFLTGGKNDKDGYEALERETKEPVPAKVVAYWQAWAERPSFKKVYQNGLH